MPVALKSLAISVLVWLIAFGGLVALTVARGVTSPLPLARAGAQGTLVALGDSYISGEGAPAFEEGTDVPGVNQCRRAPTAYPVAVAEALDLDLVFAACSGAVAQNIGFPLPVPGTPEAVQWPLSGEPLQRLVLEQHADARVVLLSIGGNDARFADIIAHCMGIGESCVALAQNWLDNMTTVLQPRLRSAYAAVRAVARSAVVYVIGYPAPFEQSLRECGRVGLTVSEVAFLRRFTARLNDEIALAAETQGFRVVVPGEDFSRHGICAPDGTEPALREWHFQWPPAVPREPVHVMMGSFHPTPAGHALLAAQLVPLLEQELGTPPPPPSGPGAPTAGPPAPPGGPPAPPGPSAPGGPPDGPPGSGPTDLPPLPPSGAVPPGFEVELGDNPCSPRAESQAYEVLSSATYTATGLDPWSTVCLRREFEDWRTVQADGSGRAVLDFGRPPTAGIQGWRSVIFRDRGGTWRSLYLAPSEQAPPPRLGIAQAWLASPSAVALLGGAGVLFVVTWVASWVLLGRRAAASTRAAG